MDFKNVIADTNGCSLDETPVSYDFGTELDLEVKALLVGKVFDLGHDQIALSMELEMFILPSSDCFGSGGID